MSEAQYKDRIQLTEIVEVDVDPSTGVRQPCWKVTLTFTNPQNVKAISAVFYFQKSQWKDDAILPMARSWFHLTCKHIADETKDWVVEKAEWERYLRKGADDQLA